MAMTWTGSGGLFTVVGKIAAAIYNTRGRRGSLDPDTAAFWGSGGFPIKCLETEIQDIIDDHSAAQSPWYDGIRETQDAMETAQDSYITALVAYATTFITNSINANVLQPDSNLSTIMTELVRQMKLDSKTVDRCTAAITATAGSSNYGVAAVQVSTTGRFGAPLEYAFAESLIATVTSDRFTGATAGSEPLSIVGAAALTDKFNNLWPDGSGASATVNIIDPDVEDTTTGNLLTNSNFETWTVTNIPDDWTILVGTVTTHVKKNITVPYDGSAAALEFVCDGSTLISVAQTFAADVLEPATVYAVNFWISADDVPLAGVIKLDLVDSTNTVINNDAATANAISVNASTLTTTYVKIGGMFQTPTNMPSQVKLRISTPTAVTNGRKVYFDFGAFAPATQLYTAGPYVAFFRGSTDLIQGDLWTLAVTNDRAGLVQTFFEQAFSLSQLGLILPSSGSPNISDSVIV